MSSLMNNVVAARGKTIASFARRPEPQRVLMCPPTYFDIIDVKNSFMQGNVGQVDREAAQRQWQTLQATFAQLGKTLVTLDAVPDLEDMVFTANQAMVGCDANGQPYAVMANMRYASRQREVRYFQAWFAQEGYQIITLDNQELFFEGHGDAIWHPGRQLLWGGYGQRTCAATYDVLQEKLQLPIVTLALVDPYFYHLDTCFCPLDEETVMLYAPAFDATGLALIHYFFPRVIEIPKSEAMSYFAGNAVVLDHKQVIIQAGATETSSLLAAAGFLVTAVETREFIKSGGSAFCLKMLVY